MPQMGHHSRMADTVSRAKDEFAMSETPPASSEPLYELYAIRYAHREAIRDEMFYEHDDCGDESMPMDYFVWLAVAGSQIVVIDTGCKRETAEQRKRQYFASPLDTMQRLGFAAVNVGHVIVTHLHWDHSGNVDQFPNAQIILQDQEMAFWTGRWGGRGQFAKLAEPADLSHLIQANMKGRIRWVDGDAEVVPGISVHRVGGHTPGMQVVRVATTSGQVVLTSDASHYFDNIEHDKPFRVLHTLPLMYAAFDRINELAGSPECIVAGHDPAVLTRFPAVSPELAGLAVRIA